MRAPALAALVLALSSCVDGSHAPPTAQEEPATPSLPMPRPETTALEFPPEPSRRPRRPLPAPLGRAAVQEPISVDSPVLDANGHFEFAGATLTIRFNRPLQAAPERPAVPPITVTPAVPGKARWTGSYGVTFEADAPFDPETHYRLEVGPLTEATGAEVPRWTATFRADPRVHVGPKVLSYVPKPGTPRVVAHDHGRKIGPRPALRVLWDQPVALATVKPWIALEQDGTAIPFRLRYPSDGRYGGAVVPRRHVVEIVPSKPLPAGAEIALTVRDDTWTPREPDRFDVADPLRFERVECGTSPTCVWNPASNLVVLGDTSLTLGFNNVLGGTDEQIARAIRITPAVANASVWVDRWSADGRAHLHAAFAPSTRYEVRMAGLRDIYGSRGDAVEFAIETLPELASVVMREGWLALDPSQLANFTIQGRNLKSAQLKAWAIPESEAAWNDAQGRLARRELPPEAPLVIVPVEFDPVENAMVDAHVDLTAHLPAGQSFVVAAEIHRPAFSAPLPQHPEWSFAARPPMAIVTSLPADALAVHARTTAGSAVVHVADLRTGAPVADARLWLDGAPVPGVTTDAQGVATFPLPDRTLRHAVLRVEHETRTAQLPLGVRIQTQNEIAPELAAGQAEPPGLVRALVLSDRGIYRPGATMEVKAIVRHPQGAELGPVPLFPVRVRVLAPSGREVFGHAGWTNDVGAFTATYPVDPTAELGRYRVVLEPLLGTTTLAETLVQVAEFEPPRFKVDVDADAEGTDLRAQIEGRYLFGAAMEAAEVGWTLHRAPEPLPVGPLVARGLQFRGHHDGAPWSRTGQGVLDGDGQLRLQTALEILPEGGPQRFTLEAEVRDASHRAIAGRDSVVVHPQRVYAGVRVVERWASLHQPLAVELGAIDPEGVAVAGQPLAAKLYHVRWDTVRQPGPGGAMHLTWVSKREEVDRCTVTSATTPVSCPLVPKRSGSYEVEVGVGGRPGGLDSAWAWGDDGDAEPMPAQGHRLELEAERRTFHPGETATVRFHNPFPQATAIATLEHGDRRETVTRTLEAGPQTFTWTLRGEHTPHVYATVTLLPRATWSNDAVPPDWRFGAVRLPVESADARVTVAVASDRPHYEPGEEARVTVHVTRDGAPVAGADVTLAIVDEGVLRLTDFHAPDPVAALRPGQALRFDVADTRAQLAELLERSSSPGDGAAAGQSSLVSSRKDFVQTLLWRPDLRSDANGEATVAFEVPDNLTEFRMMAVVLDAVGRGGRHEAGFEVRKPWMAIPALPRFALVGDTLEAAVLVHNEHDDDREATVLWNGQRRTVTVPAHGRTRVGFPWTPTGAGDERLTFALQDGAGEVRDQVETVVPVAAPGIDEHPTLLGSFRGTQPITLKIPAGLQPWRGHDEALFLTVGPHLRPDLGRRLEFLVDYPHGCLEQTTSGLLPLLVARDILPRLGFVRFTREDIDARVQAGLQRLHTMRTPSGGLAYWPGQTEPNLYATAYAMRALALAERAGIAPPRGLLDEVAGYLEAALLEDGSLAPDMQANVALALAEAGRLPASSAAMLLDTEAHQNAFGLASLALALSALPGHETRARELVGALERQFDGQGRSALGPTHDAMPYGSFERTQAQALLALTRIAPDSTLAPILEQRLLEQTSNYTTQSTAFGLLALRERMVAAPARPGRWRVEVGGVAWPPDPSSAALEGHGLRYRIPWSEVAGRTGLLTLTSDDDTAVMFALQSRWVRPDSAAGSMAATSATNGPELYRMYTTPAGDPIDRQAIRAGEVVRVALLARLAEYHWNDPPHHLAITDRIPAGFEAVQTDLWTVARAPQLTDAHPLHSMLRWGGVDASHFEIRDDAVYLYFDEVHDEYTAATYLMRATTPGRFTAPAAAAELMYTPDSSAYTDALTVEVLP